MGDFIEIIALLGFALMSILANERARAKRLQAQREMRPPPRPTDESVDEALEASVEERTPAQEMLRRLQAHASAFGIEGPVEVPAAPPPPVILEEPAADEPAEVAPILRQAPRLRPAPLQEPVPLSQIGSGPPTDLITADTGASRRRPNALLATIRTQAGLRRALLMREILGPPRAFEEHGRI